MTRSSIDMPFDGGTWSPLAPIIWATGRIPPKLGWACGHTGAFSSTSDWQVRVSQTLTWSSYTDVCLEPFAVTIRIVEEAAYLPGLMPSAAKSSLYSMGRVAPVSRSMR
ncbi:hypothetical protein HYQ46_011291 [Verticillium longisporum]|nr:hypothetical protein HYQ46_011291 [Verticillium longisporum]